MKWFKLQTIPIKSQILFLLEDQSGKKLNFLKKYVAKIVICNFHKTLWYCFPIKFFFQDSLLSGFRASYFLCVDWGKRWYVPVKFYSYNTFSSTHCTLYFIISHWICGIFCDLDLNKFFCLITAQPLNLSWINCLSFGLQTLDCKTRLKLLTLWMNKIFLKWNWKKRKEKWVTRD